MSDTSHRSSSFVSKVAHTLCSMETVGQISNSDTSGPKDQVNRWQAMGVLDWTDNVRRGNKAAKWCRRLGHTVICIIPRQESKDESLILLLFLLWTTWLIKCERIKNWVWTGEWMFTVLHPLSGVISSEKTFKTLGQALVWYFFSEINLPLVELSTIFFWISNLSMLTRWRSASHTSLSLPAAPP